MAKLPSYLKAEVVRDNKTLCFNIRIKKWGIPILAYKIFEENDAKWWQWILYPYACLKLLIEIR